MGCCVDINRDITKDMYVITSSRVNIVPTYNNT